MTLSMPREGICSFINQFSLSENVRKNKRFLIAKGKKIAYITNVDGACGGGGEKKMGTIVSYQSLRGSQILV